MAALCEHHFTKEGIRKQCSDTYQISPNYHKLYIHHMSSNTAAGVVLKNNTTTEG